MPRARRSLGIEESARSALDELRHLLETLRTPAGDADGASTVRLSALAELVAHARDNGLPTTLTVVGEPVELPDLVQVNIYRVAQEALTNARRHGGPDAAADVRLRYGADAVELEIANTGRAVAAPMRPGPGARGDARARGGLGRRARDRAPRARRLPGADAGAARRRRGSARGASRRAGVGA